VYEIILTSMFVVIAIIMTLLIEHKCQLFSHREQVVLTFYTSHDAFFRITRVAV
jgi:hypothetical protein